MANGLDRLERLFGKRKPSAASAQSVEAVSSPSSNTEPQFPSPSFIRPKTSRMAAREEVRVKQTPFRLPPFPGDQSPQRMASVTTQDSTTSTESYRPYSPIRLSTIKPWPTQQLMVEFQDFQFPRPPTHHGENYSAFSSSNAKSSFESYGRRSPKSYSPQKPDAVPPRIDTPPASDPEEEDINGSLYFINKKLPALPCAAPPTPGPSPELLPTLQNRLKGAKSTEFRSQAAHRDKPRLLDDHFDYPSLKRALSHSSLTSSSRVSSGSSTLREPGFGEFMDLSDDDIAEESSQSLTCSSRAASSTPTASSPSTGAPQSQLPITLTPPYSSRPATAAAFEIARIAKRYNFDLVYVANLWPDKARPQTSSPEQEDSSSFNSDFSSRSSSGMTGRLLAAHGLENAPSPFQISANVHGNVLRSKGWVEYRNQEPTEKEFPRGYACAFYTGNYSKTDSFHSSNSSIKSSRIDRGIVFAAYRKPRSDGSMVGMGSDEVELAKIHQDAETLVEMLIDIHVANRQRQYGSRSQLVDETGPMPMHRSRA